MIETKKPQYARLNISALNYPLRQRLLATQSEEIFDLQKVYKTRTRLAMHVEFWADKLMAQLMQAIGRRTPGGVQKKEQILESFTGKVDRIEGDIAYVSLVDRKGQKSYADYDAVELKSQGILEGSRFVCNIKKRNNETVIIFEPNKGKQRRSMEGKAGLVE